MVMLYYSLTLYQTSVARYGPFEEVVALAKLEKYVPVENITTM